VRPKRHQVGLCAAIILVHLFTSAPAQETKPSGPIERPLEITPGARQAIERGLDWLISRQQPDGSFKGSHGANTGIVSFVVLSFMTNGHLPERGPHGQLIARSIDFVLNNAQPNGLISNPDDTSNGPMYEHAMSTMMLAEIWGEYDRPGLRDKLKRAVDLILRSQSDQGGWRYFPRKEDADLSVTVTQMVALRAAKDAGLTVPKQTIDAAMRYVKSCATPGGGFRYQPGKGDVAYSRTAAGVCALLTCGDYDSPEVARGLEYLQANKSPERRTKIYPFYSFYYGAQAMYLAPDPQEWQRWYPPIRDELIGLQKSDGRWDGEAGPVYGTTMSLLALSVPYRYLPIYQR
jgi:squalene cyclase